MKSGWMGIGIAIIFEVIWVSGLKHADQWWAWLVTFGAIFVSFRLFIRASQMLPVGTLYTVFTGLGTAGTVLTEMAVFGEPFNWIKILLIALLLYGVIGLKRVTTAEGAGA
ncbi:DMT family transporter [Paenibacillus thalictri]|uniref:QacE family quaternary ammonium compound efflux SMR transporter n=1 Tax=Paenibacillus thalictri TaxID=2527873 RepID=A0A4Q9DSW0_9BACL|nr:SMR family transporter [Paenibacillus thalictri]TBL78579.1 QacE family quaternary ammonium compound efflux SMR transporter [Paenibacillus thalictri]